MYAKECKESDGTYCMYTDVAYDTCSSAAKASKFLNKYCYLHCVASSVTSFIQWKKKGSVLNSVMDQRGVLNVRKTSL